MRFKKIDEKTVCCILSEEDLTDKDITIEDFLHNRDKVQSFLEEIIETAKEEVGFEASGPMLSIQVMCMPPEGVMITFSEDPKDVAAAMKAGFGQMKDGLMDNWSQESQESVEQKQIKNMTVEDTLNDKLASIFAFDNMEAIFSFVKNAPVRSGLGSCLYKDETEGWYYMILTKERMSEERYRSVITTALEFGHFIAMDEVKCAYIREHYKCLMKEKAVNSLKKVCQNRA